MEFMISTRDGNWFEFPETCGPEVFLPYEMNASVTANSEVANVLFQNCIFSFSLEEPGVQVVLKSGNIAIESALEFVEAVSKTIEMVTNQACEYVQYS